MLDTPTPAEILTQARALLSPRAQAGLDTLPAACRADVAFAVATGAYLETWERHLSRGQPWPDVIEYRPD